MDNTKNVKCVMVIDENLPQGIIANTAAETNEENYTYYGICIYGNKKKVNKLTGSMPLLR